MHLNGYFHFVIILFVNGAYLLRKNANEISYVLCKQNGNFNPFTVNFFGIISEIWHKKSVAQWKYVVNSLATIYFQVARELMNMMMSSLLLSKQVCTIYSHLFINFALKIIFAHIQNNARHYRMVSIFCNMLRSLRVLSGAPRCWSRPLYGPDLNHPARTYSRSGHRIVRNTMQDIEDQSTCHWSIHCFFKSHMHTNMHVHADRSLMMISYSWVKCAWLPRTIYMTLLQGVVTYASPLEAFVTGIKMESSNQCSFLEPIKGSRQILSD